ncbi:hypothetical protein EVAR_21901_1 [Eumeta japonica]|uniref:Uncharacterized protein n=1 Tax=Eumeta variegata TaxID=151549 RepID=A0A4C1XJP2_EUMVA|nr:hypothetical protein EVAR_21901_1 [Eumeta japonica]
MSFYCVRKVSIPTSTAGNCINIDLPPRDQKAEPRAAAIVTATINSDPPTEATLGKQRTTMAPRSGAHPAEGGARAPASAPANNGGRRRVTIHR